MDHKIYSHKPHKDHFLIICDKLLKQATNKEFKKMVKTLQLYPHTQNIQNSFQNINTLYYAKSTKNQEQQNRYHTGFRSV